MERIRFALLFTPQFPHGLPLRELAPPHRALLQAHTHNAHTPDHQMLRRAASGALARLAPAAVASPCSSSSASFTTTTPAAARVGARSTGRVIPGHRRVDRDAPPPPWASDGWFEDALTRGGGLAAARALERRVLALGAQGNWERTGGTALR